MTIALERGRSVLVWSLLLAVGLSTGCGSSASSNGSDGSNGGGGGAHAAGTGGAQFGGSSGKSGADSGDGSSGFSGNAASGSDGGGPPTGVVLRCSAPDTLGQATNPEIQRTVQGASATSVDHCDASGNLIDYYCESKQTCVVPPGQPDPLPICTSANTGNVLSQNYDCSGHCVNGTCAARCPAFGDLLSYIAIDAATGAATLENQTDHRRYLCQLTFDEASANYDCKTGPTEELQVKMIAQGLKSSYCTGGDFGGFGVGAATATLTDTPRCDYECVLPPG